MHRLIIFSIVSVSLLLFTTACGPLDRYPTGYDESGYDQKVYTVVIQPDTGLVDSWSPASANTGYSPKIQVGSWGGYQLRTLIRFDTSEVPKLIPVQNITSCQLRLYYKKVAGNYNSNIYHDDPLTIEAHNLYSGFDEHEATWYISYDNRIWDGGSFGPTVGTTTVGSPKTQGEWISIDVTPTVLEWIAAPYNNRGLLLKARDESISQSVKDFYSLNCWDKLTVPRLIINYTYGSESLHKSLSIGVQKDATIGFCNSDPIWTYQPGFDDLLTVGSFGGYARRSYLKFNLTEDSTGIPPEASIVMAQLRMWYMPEGRGDGHRILVRRLLENWNEYEGIGRLRTLIIDTAESFSSIQLWKEPPQYVDFCINGLVQKWIDGRYNNYGLAILNVDETIDSGMCHFSSRHDPDTAKRPVLTIKYTLPPGMTPTNRNITLGNHIHSRLAKDDLTMNVMGNCLCD